MDNTLFTVFIYLSAAIAQTFAALIALTAMFYVYRESKLREERKEYGRMVRTRFITSIEGMSSDVQKGMLDWLEQFSDWELMINLLIEQRNKTNSVLTKAAAKCGPDITEALLTQYFINTNRKKIWAPILLSVITTALSILFLCFCKIYSGYVILLWVFMVSETSLALVTLAFIAYRIKSLIKEPNVKGMAQKIKEQLLKDYEKKHGQKP